MVAGDFLLGHPGSRMACIEVGRRQTPAGLVVEHFALAEGLPDGAIADLLGAWDARYGIPASRDGAPFALRLPLPLSQVHTPGIADLHRVALPGTKPAGHILHGDLWDLWIDCQDALAAEFIARWLPDRMPPMLDVSVAVGDPPIADQECWAALRLAEEVRRVA